jgi:hypothetical protein
MVSLSLFAFWTIVRHDDAPSRRRLVWAVGATAVATFIKPPVAFFFLAGAFVSLGRAQAVPRASRRRLVAR